MLIDKLSMPANKRLGELTMKALFTALFLMTFEYTYAASFDCGASLNNVERMICNDNQLSVLDDKMGALYKYSYVNEAERKDQLNWLKKRNSCKDAGYIATLYRERIEILEYFGLSIQSCITSKAQLSELADADDVNFYYLDGEQDLNDDGVNELIYSSGGCNAHCSYSVYEIKNGCYYEIASFSAREYFVVSANSDELSNYISNSKLVKFKKSGEISSNSASCLLINDVEPMLDGATGPKYTPWCFDKKQ